MSIQKQLNQVEKQQVGVVDLHEPTIGGGGYHETKTGTQFFRIKETKGERWTEEYYKTKVNTCFTQMGERGDQDIWKGVSSGYVELS